MMKKKIVPEKLEKVLIDDLSSTSSPVSHINQALKEFVQSTRGDIPKYLYQSSTPCFHYNVLLEQFLIHIFNPISRLYLIKRYGHQAVRNQFSGYVQLWAHLYWFVGLFYLVFRDELRDNGITDAEVGIGFFAGTMLRLTIATKYASMSPEEYMTFMMCENLDKALEYQQHTQLNTGWLSVDIPFCAHEANLALERMGFHLGSTLPPCFEVKCDEIGNWRSILGESSSVLHTRQADLSNTPYASVNVDVADLMAMIVAACDYRVYIPYFLPPIIILVVLWSLLPNFIRMSCDSLSQLVTYEDVSGLCKSNSFLGNGHLTKTFSVLMISNTFVVSLPLFTFFVSTILGCLRHRSCANTYGLLARVDHFSPTVAKCPIIDMTIHTNVRAWVRSLLALHFFGERYYKRVDIYAKLCALILVGLLVWLYIFSLQVEEETTGANELILDIRYWSVCFLLIVWGGAFALILAIMSDTNFAMKQYEILFLLHRLSVRERRVIKQRTTAIKKMKGAVIRHRMSMMPAKSNGDKTGVTESYDSNDKFMDILKTMARLESETESKVPETELTTMPSTRRKMSRKLSIGEFDGLVKAHDSIKIERETELDTDDESESNRPSLLPRVKEMSSSSSSSSNNDMESDSNTSSVKESLLKKDSTTNNVKKEIKDDSNDALPPSLKESLLEKDSTINNAKKETSESFKFKFDRSEEPSSPTYYSIDGLEALNEKRKSRDQHRSVDDIDSDDESAMLTMSDSELRAQWLKATRMMENEQLDDLMDTAVMIMESQMRVNPRRFLGVSATWNLMKSFTFAWATLIAFALSVAGIQYQ